MSYFKLRTECNHCYHAHRGPIWMVIPNGHVVEECCKCHSTRTVHVEHRTPKERCDSVVKRIVYGRQITF